MVIPKIPVVMPRMPEVIPKMPTVVWGFGCVRIWPHMVVQVPTALHGLMWDPAGSHMAMPGRTCPFQVMPGVKNGFSNLTKEQIGQD